MSDLSRLAGLAGISPACALVGGMIDERTHLGFTNWQSACRASGISVRSLTYFTFELLPTAVAGALFGALLVLVLAFLSRHRQGSAERHLAAHTGCAVAMPLGLILCALAFPIPVMLAAEVALAVTAAYVIRALAQRKSETRVLLHP
jgi:hypothetical protein